MAVWEAKIKLAGDLENSGSWNVVRWCEALAKKTGKPVIIVEDPRLKPVEEEREKDGFDDDKAKI